MAVVAQKLENSGKFYMAFWRTGSRAPIGRWNIYERNPDGERGRFLALFTIENKNYGTTLQTDWNNLPPSDPVALKLERMVREGLEETQWMMEKREK